MTSITDINTEIKSPIGDYLGLLGNCQHDVRCRTLELNVLDCTDVWGHRELKKKCKNLYDDYLECIFHKKQEARYLAMQKERMRQYLAGERTKKDFYAKSPPLDTFDKTYTANID